MAARSGQALSARALRRTVTLLYQLGRFSDVVVRGGFPELQAELERFAGGVPPGAEPAALANARPTPFDRRRCRPLLMP